MTRAEAVRRFSRAPNGSLWCFDYERGRRYSTIPIRLDLETMKQRSIRAGIITKLGERQVSLVDPYDFDVDGPKNIYEKILYTLDGECMVGWINYFNLESLIPFSQKGKQ